VVVRSRARTPNVLKFWVVGAEGERKVARFEKNNQQEILNMRLCDAAGKKKCVAGRWRKNSLIEKSFLKRTPKKKKKAPGNKEKRWIRSEKLPQISIGRKKIPATNNQGTRRKGK